MSWLAGALKLGAADGGVQVGHPVIPRRLAVPVFHRVIADLVDQVPVAPGSVVVAGEDDAAAAGESEFVGVDAGRGEAATGGDQSGDRGAGAEPEKPVQQARQ